MFNEEWSAREQDIAQEWIQRDSEKRCLGRLFGCCPFSCYRRMTIMCCYVTYFTFGVLTAAVLVVMTILVFQPFKDPVNYTEAACTTYDKYYDNMQMLCSCGAGCRSEYPCLKVYAWYITKDGENVTDAMLKDSTLSESCTYTPFCVRDPKVNNDSVESYDSDHALLGVEVPCLYDPNEVTNVIRKHAADPLLPYPVLAGPAAGVLLCALLFVMVYHVCGCRYICRMTPPEDIKAEAVANPLVATELTPAGIVITEVPSNQNAGGDGASQVPLVEENNKEESA